jgi:hypothetical protein
MKRCALFAAAVLSCVFSVRGLEAPHRESAHFEKGYIIKNGGYASPGFLFREPDDVISKAVQFTQDSSQQAKQTVFYPADLEGFFFETDSVTFESVDYSLTKDTAKAGEKRFAKKLFEGYAALYKLRVNSDEQKDMTGKNDDFVYVLRMDREDNVLRDVDATEGTNCRSAKNYVGTLKYLFKDCPAVQSALRNLRFNDDAMISIVKKYCKCVRPDDTTLVALRKARLLFFHEPEAAFSFFNFNGWARIYSIGYMLETVYPDMSDRISLVLGLKYNRLEQNGEKGIDGFEIPILAGYNFDNEKVSPFINYGANLHYFVFDRIYSLVLSSLRVGLKLYGIKIIGQVEALNIVDMARIGQIKIYTIALGYEF